MESTQNPSASLVKLALTTPSRSDVVAIFKVRCAACRAETRGGRADWVGKVEILEDGNLVAFARFRYGGSRHDVGVAMSHASPGQFEAKCRHGHRISAPYAKVAHQATAARAIGRDEIYL